MSSPPPPPPPIHEMTADLVPTPTLSAAEPVAAEPVEVGTFPSEAAALLRDLNLVGTLSTANSGQGQGTITQSPADEARAAAVSGSETGVSIPGYEILGELGRGGMGVVYKARQVSLNRTVALKTIRGNRVGQKDLARFLIEAEAVAAIEHPNVVRVYAYGDHNGQPYMALEYLPGGTLSDRIKNAGKLSPSETASLVATVARGVAAAHALGIVHRDLKPANVLFSGTGERTSGVFSAVQPSATPTAPIPDTRDTKPDAKVADFGLAKRGSSDLTQTQAVMGTPAYMAPEQADGKTKFVGPTADVWSLGIILYECLHGERPFDAPDVHSLLGMIRSAELPPIDSQARIPRELDLICRKCLEKNPADRYPSAAELADDLERFTRGDPVTVRPLSSAARSVRWAKRNPVVAGLLSAVFLISVGLVVSLFAQYRQAVAQVESERRAKKEADDLRKSAEELASKNAALAESEKSRRQEAERLKQLADAEAARANQVSDFMTGVFRGSDPLDIFGEDVMPQSWEKQRLKTTETLLRDAAEKFKTELKGPSLARAKLLNVVANSMTNLGDYKTAEPLLNEALAIRKSHLSEDHPDIITNELDLGRMYWNLGDFIKALEAFRAVIVKQRRSGAPETAILTSRFYEALTLTFIDHKQADAVFREVVAGRERLRGLDHIETIMANIGYASLLLDEGRVVDLLPVLPKITGPLKSNPNPAFRNLGDTVAAFQEGVGFSTMATATPALAENFRRKAEVKLKEALKKGEQHLPADHWTVGMIRYELAGVLADLGKDAEADALYLRLLEGIRRAYGFAHPKLLLVGRLVGDRWARAGKVADARKLWDELDTANETQFGPANYWRGSLLFHRVRFETMFGTHANAQKFAEKALELVRAGKVAHNKQLGFVLIHCSRNFARAGLAEPAKAIARELFDTTRRYVDMTFGPKSREMCFALMNEGMKLSEMGDRVAGAARLKEAETLISLISSSSDDEDRHDLLGALGKAENARGEFAKAEKYYAKALAISTRNDWKPSYRRNDSVGLVTALVGQRKFAEAIPHMENLQRWKTAEKFTEGELAWSEMVLGAVRFAAGEKDEHRKGAVALLERHEKAVDVNILSRLAWILGVSPETDQAEAAGVAKRLAARMSAFPKFAWGHWALALIRLRAGDLDGADAALKAGGTTWHTPPREAPFVPLIAGLCAVKRGDLASARTHLQKAEELIAAEMPSEKNPFSLANVAWDHRFLAEVLHDELRAAVAPREIAPTPREVK